MEQEIKLHLDGENLSLETFSLSKLNSIVEKYAGILNAMKPESQKGTGEKNYEFSLTGIERGSVSAILCQTGGGSFLLEQAEKLNEAFRCDTWKELAENVIEKITDFARELENQHLTADLWSGDRSFEFIPALFIAKPFLIKERTTIYGEVVEVGGLNPNAHLVVPGQEKKVRCDVSRDLALELGSRLYTVVELSGEAEIEYPKGKIRKFVVEALGPYDERKWDENVKWLSEIFTRNLKGVDVQKLFDEMRSGE